MKIPQNCKVELTTAKPENHPLLAEPCLDIRDGKGILVSTDGKVMTVIPVEIDAKDVQGYVSGDALKAARKLAKSREPASILLTENAILSNGASLPRNGIVKKESVYPNWRICVPTPYEGDGVMVIGIDAKRLWNLAQAMGTETVSLRIKTKDDPIQIAPMSCGANREARGVIMPTRVS